MTILVSDTSVLIDLERGDLISCAFRLSATFAVPDVLYERELRDHGGEELMKLGLKVQSLDGDGVALAMRHLQAQRHLTVPDSFALALAKQNGWTLLTGDGPLRNWQRWRESIVMACYGCSMSSRLRVPLLMCNFTEVLKESPLIHVAGCPGERLRFVLADTLNTFDRAMIRFNSMQVTS
jgi:hypothetical protein